MLGVYRLGKCAFGTEMLRDGHERVERRLLAAMVTTGFRLDRMQDDAHAGDWCWFGGVTGWAAKVGGVGCLEFCRASLAANL